jgi:uncharacterized protein (DUF3820 family)
MPWGKHRGKYLTEIPDAYLKWAIMNWDDAGMADMMAIELSRRFEDLRRPVVCQTGRKTT